MSVLFYLLAIIRSFLNAFSIPFKSPHPPPLRLLIYPKPLTIYTHAFNVGTCGICVYHTNHLFLAPDLDLEELNFVVVLLFRLLFLSGSVWSGLVLFFLVLSCLSLSILFCIFLSCLVSSRLVLSCFVLSCLVSSCLVSSRLVASRLVLFCHLVLSCLFSSVSCVVL